MENEVLKEYIRCMKNSPVLYVDMTPDEELPLRILRAYRQNCDCRWSNNSGKEPDDLLLKTMNQHQEQRAKLLDEAIRVLEENKYILSKFEDKVFEKKEWQEAGWEDLDVARKWWKVGWIEPEEALKWYKYGWDDVNEAKRWYDEGWEDPEIADMWLDAGWANPSEAFRWFDAEWECPIVAIEWYKYWRNNPEVAVEWFEAGWEDSPREAKEWADAGWENPKEALNVCKNSKMKYKKREKDGR